MQKPNNTGPLLFGEVLFDHFPDGAEVLGGAPFNVAWHLQGFGTNPLFISRVGDDEPGRQIYQAMRGWDMNTRGLQSDALHPTGSVEIKLEAGQPSFSILPDQAYDYISVEELTNAKPPSFIYYGSLALRSPASRSAFQQLVKQFDDSSLFMDVNLRAPWWNKETVIELLKAARWAKLNDDELRILVPTEDRIKAQAQYLQDHCDLELVIVTQGAKGAFTRQRDGELLDITPQTTTAVVDTVGAGDAFSSVILLGLIENWGLEQTLARAQSFASEIVGLRGAITNNKAFYLKFIQNWS